MHVLEKLGPFPSGTDNVTITWLILLRQILVSTVMDRLGKSNLGSWYTSLKGVHSAISQDPGIGSIVKFHCTPLFRF